ncbi:MAG: 2-oxoglutarate dehydrogenase, E2 component, dihydrolipoamide succinyltransferase [Ignavibacteria bacterium]|nr:2-oxoglutarate dehydrogenase, E2 component, dihydrolipoamide succinyltransferase [Ignavibacteria bacterium]
MNVIMPKMGESVIEGTIIKWHKKVGDQVKRDEIIFEISTDKVDTEIPSPADGVLKEIKVNEGDTVEVGTVVAIINENGEVSEKPQQAETEVKEEKKSEKVEDKKPKEEEETKKQKLEPSKKEEPSGEIIEIAMPKMGESVMEGTIIKWHKKVGDRVKKDETIFEISTDKVDTEVPSPEEGTLAEILVAENETVEIGTIVAKLSTGEGIPAKKESKEKVPDSKEIKKGEVKEEKEKKAPEAMHESFSDVSAREEEKTSGGFFSPLVMNIAKKENISYDELNKIKGTGFEGRVTKKDILNYIESGRTQQKQTETKKAEETKVEEKKAPTPSYKPSYTSDEIEKIPMDNIRQKIMEHMIRSRDTSVHVAAMLEADMTRIHNFIKKHRDEFYNRDGVKLTYMAFIAHACVKALKEYPLINATIESNTIIKKKFINLGIAVAIEPTGLIVPNIKAADQKNLVGLAHSVNDLALRSRNKKLTPDDITGGTFTITNYGVFGTIMGTPIINQPEVAILGVGIVVKKPVVVEVEKTDTIAVRHIMTLTLSYDHRLVDGMLGGRFLKFLKDTLENFDPESI